MKRIVKLIIAPESVDAFIANFYANQSKILAFPGCHHVELLRGMDDSNIFFTLSIWDGPDALEAYRQSKLFQGIWTVTKTMFDGRPEAWSVTKPKDK